MSRKSLDVLFHMGTDEYNEEYDSRFNAVETIHIPISINGNPAFVCQTIDMYKKIVSIERLDKSLNTLYNSFPKIAINQFTTKCMIDEILQTNGIEGVHSTRKEVSEILQDISVLDKRNRMVGLVSKYMNLDKNQSILLKSSKDIRKIYDDIFYDEIKETNPENLPDGDIFRRTGVEVQSPTQKVIHRGVMPETKIIDMMDSSLSIVNDENIDVFIRIAIFHYLFGYIHPFYDGNGRTSRYISSVLLLKQLNPLVGFRLSYAIKETISKYYKAFTICNNPHNKAELTPFVDMFLDIIKISIQQLIEILTEKKIKWNYYREKIFILQESEKSDMRLLYNLLLQATLFSNMGISRDELITHMKLSSGTLRTRLRLIHRDLLIENVQKHRKYYLLDLGEFDRILEQ